MIYRPNGLSICTVPRIQDRILPSAVDRALRSLGAERSRESAYQFPFHARHVPPHLIRQPTTFPYLKSARIQPGGRAAILAAAALFTRATPSSPGFLPGNALLPGVLPSDRLPSDPGPSRTRWTSRASGPSPIFPILLPIDPARPRSISLSRPARTPSLWTDSSVSFPNMMSSKQRDVEDSVSPSTSADRSSTSSRWRAESRVLPAAADSPPSHLGFSFGGERMVVVLR